MIFKNSNVAMSQSVYSTRWFQVHIKSTFPLSRISTNDGKKTGQVGRRVMGQVRDHKYDRYVIGEQVQKIGTQANK